MTDAKSIGEATEPQNWGLRGTAGVSFAATLEFDAVEVTLGGRPVLDKLALSLRPGEIVCLLGESGSGKSTALRVAAGIQPVSAGALRINGEVMSAPGRTVPPDRRGIGLMFQDYALFPHLSVLDNVLFGLRRLGAMRPCRGPARRSRVSASSSGSATIRTSSPAASSSAWPSRAASRRARASSSSTNRFRASMRACAKPCATKRWPCCARRAPPASSSPTIPKRR